MYSGQHYNTDQKLYERFTEETGIRVKLLEAKDDALIQRLGSEGESSPADVLILADAAGWIVLGGALPGGGVSALEAAIPANLRDPDNRWFGLTRRMRVPMLNPDKVQSGQVNRYSKLADRGLAGKLCHRPQKRLQPVTGGLHAESHWQQQRTLDSRHGRQPRPAGLQQ